MKRLLAALVITMLLGMPARADAFSWSFISYVATVGTAATAWASYAEFMCWMTGGDDYWCKTADALQSGGTPIVIGQ